MFKIDATQFLDFAEQMGAADELVKKEMSKAVVDIANEGAEIARSILASNGSVVTGELYNSIQGRGGGLVGNSLTASYGPASDEPGKWVEGGRGPVRATRAKFLKFQIKGAGPYLYRKSVRAAAPRPFMAPSVPRVQPYAAKRMGEAVMAAIRQSF